MVVTDEILRRVGEKTGLSESDMKSFYDGFLTTLYYVAHRTDATSIRLGELGKIHIKAYHLERTNNRFMSKHMKEEKLAKIHTYLEERVKPPYPKIFKKSHHVTVPVITRRKKGMEKAGIASLRDLEKIQNEL